MLAIRSTIIMLLISVVGISSSHATEAPLKGLSGVRVFVAVSRDAVSGGLTEGNVRAEVELMLRAYKVPVLTQQEYAKQGGALTVEVKAFFEHTITGKKQGYFSVIRLKVEEYAYLQRNVAESASPAPILVVTWETEIASSGPPENLRKGSTEGIQNVSKEFINEYLATNASKQ